MDPKRTPSEPEELRAEIARLEARVAELERGESAWLHLALQAAQMGLWSWGVDSGAVRWSDEMAMLFGLGPGEFGGTYESYLSLVHPEDRGAVSKAIDAGLDSDATSYSIEHRTLWPDGSVHWIQGRGRILRDEAGRATGITGTGIDVTQQKKVELALRASEAAFRTVLETVPSYIVSVAPDRRIRFLNRTLPHLSVHDVVGVDVLEFMAEESRDEYARAFRRAVETGELQELEGKALQPEGEPGSFLLRMGPVKKGDTVDSVTIVGVDVTELKRAEHALRESQEQLRLAQRLESVGRLAGGVAHDFNNLLTVVTGCIDLLEPRVANHPEVRELVQPIRDAAERGASLTGQLLAFARKQVVQPQVVDLNDRIRSSAELLGRLLGENVELVLGLSDGLWPIDIDPGQFEQVLVNLAINARDAMPAGGTLTIESRNTRVVANTPGADALPDGDWVLVVVSDTGEGIGEESLPFIFEPFYTTKGAGEGTGLGLATCFGIVRQSGGHIVARSELGAGTRFRVYLHRSSGVPAAPEEGPRSRELVTGSGTVLLVEDDATVRSITRATLISSGYDLLEAPDGVEALRLFRENRGRIDLLVTDVVMPKMGGTDLARELLSLQPDLLVLFVSGYSEELDSLHDLLGERVHLLPKPYSANALTQKICELGLPGPSARPALPE